MKAESSSESLLIFSVPTVLGQKTARRLVHAEIWVRRPPSQMQLDKGTCSFLAVLVLVCRSIRVDGWKFIVIANCVHAGLATAASCSKKLQLLKTWQGCSGVGLCLPVPGAPCVG